MLCFYCAPRVEIVLVRLDHATVLLPERAHISPEDGGHLLVVANRHVVSRRDLGPVDLLSMDALSVLASRALESVFDSDWTNYQENGNWSVDEPERAHVHLHVYGRRRSSLMQPIGEALSFPKRADLSDWRVRSPSMLEIERLRSAIESSLSDMADSDLFHAIELLRS